jgi:hypothetical protein
MEVPEEFFRFVNFLKVDKSCCAKQYAAKGDRMALRNWKFPKSEMVLIIRPSRAWGYAMC